MPVMRVLWTENCEYSAYIEVPEGFDAEKYDLANALGEINSDLHFIGLEREVDEAQIMPSTRVPSNEEIEEIDWEGYDNS